MRSFAGIVFPESTLFGKRIPKNKFYEKLEVNAPLRRSFIAQIDTIIWRNKIAPSTVNIAAGSEVAEIEVLELDLKTRDLDQRVLTLIDREIPYHLLYLLVYGDEACAMIAYKTTAMSGNRPFKVGNYYSTGWMPVDSVELTLQGQSCDAVYENFVRQIAGDALAEEAAPLAEAVASDMQRAKLEREIEKLESRLRREKQFNIQVEINTRIKGLRKELEGIS